LDQVSHLVEGLCPDELWRVVRVFSSEMRTLEIFYRNAAAGLSILSSAAKAQVLYGVLTGNVTDPSSAAVPDAQVEALNMATGVSRQTTADSAGIYRFAELQPGIYKVTVSAASFGASVTENVRVEANNTRRVDVQLQLKAQTESVTVSAAPPMLQTDRADVHTDISGREIEDLPVLASNGRNFQNAYRIIRVLAYPAKTTQQRGIRSARRPRT